jgi:predicted Zn-dependent protease
VESIVWPGTVAAPPLPSSGGSLTDAAPIASLIGKLEARLAAEPGDASGWTLLAQSYAFTGNEEAAEHALKRAVELGIDEVQLRNRVKLARRKNSAGNWIDRAIGG